MDRIPAVLINYPTAIQAGNGRVDVTYTHDAKAGKSIKHVGFDPAWLAK